MTVPEVQLPTSLNAKAAHNALAAAISMYGLALEDLTRQLALKDALITTLKVAYEESSKKNDELKKLIDKLTEELLPGHHQSIHGP